MRNRPLPTPKAYTPAPETHKGSQNVPVEDVVGRRYGDVGYLTLLVADGERAARLFSGLFDWQLEPGYQPGAFHISWITPPAGIDSRPGSPEVRLYFRVDDQGLRFDLFRPKPGQ